MASFSINFNWLIDYEWYVCNSVKLNDDDAVVIANFKWLSKITLILTNLASLKEKKLIWKLNACKLSNGSKIK